MAITWTITKDVDGTVRMQCDGSNPIDLNLVQIGDYVNISGVDFNASNTGSFEITNVEVYYDPTLHQAIEFTNSSGVAEVAIQNDINAVMFFRPNVQTTQVTNGRTVVVSSTEDQKLEISIPATTEAVNRQATTGSYLHENDSFQITQISRDKSGLVTVRYSGTPSPALSIGDTVLIDNVNITPAEVFRSPGDQDAYPNDGTTDAQVTDNADLLQEVGSPTEVGRNGFAIIKAPNGDALIMGGHSLVAGVITGSNKISRFRSVSSAAVSDATLADGSTRYTYNWQTPGGSIDNLYLRQAANITVGPSVGTVMVKGGSGGLGNWSQLEAPTEQTFKYNPNTNSTTVLSIDTFKTFANTLIVLYDGRILSYGGADQFWSGACQTYGYIWNPGTETWADPADVNTTDPRGHHVAVELQDHKILLAGGVSGAREPSGDTNQDLVYWPINDLTATGNIVDALSATYTLAVTGTSARVIGQVGPYKEFTQAAYASGAGDAAAVTALLDEWTIQWWSCGASGAYPGSMVLDGLGSGTIVAYGGAASETEANNTLVHIYLSGGNLVCRWEHGAGVDVSVSHAIANYVTDDYNHFTVRKSFNGVDYDVEMFCNGVSIGSTTGLTNASGGTTSQWYIAKDPDGVIADGFSGVIGTLHISKYARDDTNILLNFFEQCGYTQPYVDGSRLFRTGKLWERCEIFDPDEPFITSVTQAANMAECRAFHTGTLLPDGRVIVIGGLSHNPTNFLYKLNDAGTLSKYGPSESSNTSEIYDPTVDQWEKGPTFRIRRHKHSAVYVPSRNSLFIIGGESTQGDDVLVVEVLDLNTMKVSQFNQKLTYKAGGAVLLDNGTQIFVASNEIVGGTSIVKQHQIINLESPYFSSTNIKDDHTIVGVGSGYFQYQTPNAKHIFSNFAPPNKDNIPGYTINNAVRTSNETTLTFDADHPFSVDDTVYVNFDAAGAFGSGVFTVTAIAADTITYSETAADEASTPLTGFVYKNYSPEASFFQFAAVSDSIPGPYLLDPINGVSISNITDSVGGSLFDGLYKNQKYSVLPLVDASSFPDEEGFVVIGFGSDIQTRPIKYFGRYSTEGLMIDRNYTFEFDIPASTNVTLLTQRDPFIPDELVGQCYITDSAAGRVAAENTIKDIIAAGIDADINIVFPGDRGLGGEGHPVKGATKLSDITTVFGSGTDLDNELKELKEDK